MALSAAQWATQVDARPNAAELRKQIMWTDAQGEKKFPEGGNTGWRHNELWQTLLRIYLESEFSTENINFLEDVDAFKSGAPRFGQGAPPTAQQLDDQYLADGAPTPINLPSHSRARLREALAGDDASERLAALDEADVEITRLTGNDSYPRLKKELSDVVQPAWAEAANTGKAKVGAPEIVGPAVVLPEGWMPNNAAVDAAQAKNRANVKAIPGNGTGPISAGGAMVLVGSGHDPKIMAYVERQGDHERGVLTVTKAGAFSKGALKVSGISAKKALVEKMLNEFSDKQVTFP